MSKPRFQFSLATVCGIVAATALALSQRTVSQGVFVLTWVILSAATLLWAFRQQPFWKGFAISGAAYLFGARLLARPPALGQPDVMFGVHSFVALTVGCAFGTLIAVYHCRRSRLPSS
jgi:hypothetical protein